jgi:uncharacterized protein
MYFVALPQNMKGETSLQKILSEVQPILQEGIFVFCTLKNEHATLAQHAQMSFREKEGTTYIIEKELAIKENVAFTFECAWITLSVHSALQAVGLTATFSKLLAQNNISCNVVAAYYHDHIFVDVKNAKKAVAVLQNLKNFYKALD